MEPTLEVGSTYDSNVLGVRGGPGSEILRVAPSIAAQTDWSRAAAGFFLGFNHNKYLETPNQTRTDVTLALGGNVAIGRGKLSVGYSHLRLHDDPATIGSIPSSTPTPIDIDSVRTNYDISIGRFSLNPFVEASHYSYGKTLIGGVEANQSFRDRSLIQAGSAARFNLGERRDVLASLSLVRTNYDRAQAGQPSASSTGVVALGGVDYQVNGTLDTRVLVGVQSRSFDTRAYRSRVIPVGMVSATWWGQRQTAVALTLSRSLEDLAEEDTGGTIYTRGEMLVTHEARPNLILRARTGAARAEFLTRRATEAYVYGGVGLEWTVNRGVKFQADAEIRRNSAPTTSNLSSSASGPYTRAIAHVGFVLTL